MRMKLHEAILEALDSHGCALSFGDVARHIATRGTYLRPKDGLPPPPGQIRLRVLSPTYAALFRVEGGRVSASGAARPAVSPAAVPVRPVAPPEAGVRGKVALDAFSFVPVAGYEADAPACRGFYAIRLRDVAALPPFYAEVLRTRGHRLLYVGQASRSLSERLGAELRAVGQGTFFRSVGAILGFTPPPGSLAKCSLPMEHRFSAGVVCRMVRQLAGETSERRPPVNVSLNAEWEAFIQEQVASGELDDADAVLDGLFNAIDRKAEVG